MSEPDGPDVRTIGTPRWRLLVAAAVCALSLRVGWAHSYGSTGHQTPGMTLPYTYVGWDGYTYIGQNYYAGHWVAGDPFRVRRGFEAEERVVLVPLVVALGWAATERSGRGRRVVAPAAVAMAVLAVLSATRGMPAASVTMAVALVLVGPLVRPGWSLAPRPPTAPTRF